MTARGHERFEENLAPYLLGALPELEATALQRHLMGCESCREELARLHPAAEAIPLAVEPVEPPAELKAALMEAVGGEPASAARAPRRVEPRTRRRLRLPRLGSPLVALRPTAAWASAALFLVAGAAGGWSINQLTEADEKDDSRTLTAEVDRSRFTRGSGSLVLPDRNGQTAVLRVQGMRPAPKGKAYEIWVQRGEEVKPASLFTVGADGTGLGAIDEDFSDVDAVFVTRERAGGARAPTEKPVVQVEL